MNKSKINIDPMILSAITSSTVINTTEKIDFLRYVGYMTATEKKELMSLI